MRAGRFFVFGTVGIACVMSGCVREDEISETGTDTPTYTRVVSLAPSTTELLFAIGAGSSVVGRTRWDVDPPEVVDVPSVGDGLEPNVEAVLARRPDLVLLYDSPSNTIARETFERLGIGTLVFSMDRLADVVTGARRLGSLVGLEAEADARATQFAASLDSAWQATGTAETSVLILAWDQPPIVIGGSSFQSELVALAGAFNAFADIELPSGQVSIETIAARDPDVVLLTSGEEEPAWADRPEWQTVRAVREGRFATVSGTHFSHPSLRALDAVRELRAALERVR